jgi:branched-chain amino acid transport system substrate-binding protein
MKKYNILWCILIVMSFLLIACSPMPATNEPTDESVQENLTNEDEIQGQDPVEESSQLKTESAFKLYISADRTGTIESGIAIEQGIRTALNEVNNTIGGKSVELVVLDHRGSTPRANEHLEMYLEDNDALALFSGLHSPPLLASRDYINENKILVLDPWAAAGPITRFPSKENWIFRLSVDDTKAGQFITDYAIGNEGFKKPYLLLEETGWGVSNEKNMTAALNTYGIEPSEVAWFNWNLGKNQAKVLLRQAKNSGADVIFFVGNAPEGKVFATAMSELSNDERLPIRSHWGITGGDFPIVINNQIRSNIDLKFIQTSFSFMNMTGHPIANNVFMNAKEIYPDTIKNPSDILAPTGFSHSYDLTKLLIEAANQIELGEDIVLNREMIRKSLETLENPVVGLVKTYNKPFSIYSEDNIDAHEALGLDDLKMARYGNDNEIILLD